MILSWLLNLHPATVHFPIGLLAFASVAGLLYIYWKPAPTLRILTWWPMIVGWVSCVIAVLSGLLAQSNLPTDAPYWQVLNSHVTTGLAILVVYGMPLYLRWIRGKGHTQQHESGTAEPTDPLLDDTRLGSIIGLSVALIAGAILVGITGWSGGQLVYSWGVNVGQ